MAFLEQIDRLAFDLVKLIEDRNVLLVKGAVPGKKGGEVMVTYSKKSEYVLSGKAAEEIYHLYILQYCY